MEEVNTANPSKVCVVFLSVLKLLSSRRLLESSLPTFVSGFSAALLLLLHFLKTPSLQNGSTGFLLVLFLISFAFFRSDI